MSTIAWDGRYLAADKQVTWGNTPTSTSKVFIRADGVVYGVCGDKDNVETFRAWMDAGETGGKPPIDDALRFSAIIIDGGNCYQVNSGLFRHKIEKGFWAAGSGADYALGALAMGASARRAVEIASSLDVNTGIGVDIVSVLELTVTSYLFAESGL